MSRSDLTKDTTVHVVIPDAQVKPGTPMDHLRWAGQYIADQFGGRPNVKLVVIGDWWDMQSLSSYDRGKKAMEGRRVAQDIDAGNEGWEMFNEPIGAYNKGRRKLWNPEKHFFDGNHENRVTRAIESDAQLDGLLTLDDMLVEAYGWERHEFLEAVCLDGVWYSHYFYNPMSGRPYGGQSMDTRLKTIGHSFTMGHQQGLLWGRRETIGGGINGLVAGSFYVHDEDYKGPQANRHWRGIVVCHQVENGEYDPMFLSLEYLCRRYAGMNLTDYKRKKGLT